MKKRFNLTWNGIIEDNPIFTTMIGLCPIIAVTTTLFQGIGMGICVIFVLTFSNFFVSLFSPLIPNNIRIPSYIIIIATFVTLVQMILETFLPTLSLSLGSFVALIVVNCLILGRAEAFAGKNKPLISLWDGFCHGVGFLLAAVIISFLRELLGYGTITVWNGVVINLTKVIEKIHLRPIDTMTTRVGGFLMLGLVMALWNEIRNKKKVKKNDAS
jgi:electron transport complex protein RnfE